MMDPRKSEISGDKEISFEWKWVREMSGFQSGTAALTGHWKSQSLLRDIPNMRCTGCLAIPPSDGCKDQQDNKAVCEKRKESINNPSACDS